MEVPEAVGSRWHGGATGPDWFHLQPPAPQLNTEGKVCPLCISDHIIILRKLICAGNDSCLLQGWQL